MSVPTVQKRWVTSHLAFMHEPVPEADACTLAQLVADTVAIGWYARERSVGATRFDEVALGDGSISVWGSEQRRPLLDAAWLNGSAAEALDYQEVLIDGRNNGHAAVVIVPALLALAEQRRVPGLRLMQALRVAFVANISLARTLGRGHRLETPGFRTTSLVAPIAAALGAAALLGDDPDIAAHAVGIAAASLPAGLLAAMSPLTGDFSDDKDLSVGFSARHALHAALLASAGARGPGDALTGPRGWTLSYGFGTAEPARLACRPGEADLTAYAIKPYAANFGCQCAIRLALELREHHAVEHVERVSVRVKSSSASSLSTRDISTHVAARFSIAYAVASAWLRGRSVLADFEGDALRDTAVLAFMDRIDVIGDAALEQLHLEQGVFPARVSVRTTAGITIDAGIDMPFEGMAESDRVRLVAAKIDSLCPPVIADRLHLLCRQAGDPSIFASLIEAFSTPTEDLSS